MSEAQRIGLVTGAGSGIGRASARLLASGGAHITVADVDELGGRETVSLITADGGAADFVRCDVSSSADVSQLVATILERHGRLDIAHNNAGICPVGHTTETLDEETWDRVIGVNLKGVWLSMKFELGAMREQGSGAIVNTSSVCGLRATRMAVPYSTSKFGVIGLTQEAALDFAQFGIRVNAVLPGVVDTAMAHGISTEEQIEAMGAAAPIGRVAQPEEIAAAAAWLLSDAASYVTGHNLAVDGGLVLPLPLPVRAAD